MATSVFSSGAKAGGSNSGASRSVSSHAQTKPPHSRVLYDWCLTLPCSGDSSGSDAMATQLPSTSNFQPWYRQRNPHSSLRPKTSEALRCGQSSSSNPSRPSLSRKQTYFRPTASTRSGFPSGSSTSSLRHTGVQCWRISKAIGESFQISF